MALKTLYYIVNVVGCELQGRKKGYINYLVSTLPKVFNVLKFSAITLKTPLFPIQFVGAFNSQPE